MNPKTASLTRRMALGALVGATMLTFRHGSHEPDQSGRLLAGRYEGVDERLIERGDADRHANRLIGSEFFQ